MKYKLMSFNSYTPPPFGNLCLQLKEFFLNVNLIYVLMRQNEVITKYITHCGGILFRAFYL